MMFGIDEVIQADFRTSAEADQIAGELKDALGLSAYNILARLAIGRSLSLSDPPGGVKKEGRVIKGGTLFGSGADLGAWLSLLIEHRGQNFQNIEELQSDVAAHWDRGLRLLFELWENCDHNPTGFWRTLAQSVLPHGISQDSTPADVFETSPGLLQIPIGQKAQDMASGEKVIWKLNAPGASPHLAVMGGVNSGKTRTVVEILRALRNQCEVPLLAFDFKGDLTGDKNTLDRFFSTKVLSPPHEPIPLDVLDLTDRSETGIKVAAQRLRDSLATLKGAGFGAQQKDALAVAAERALRQQVPCALADVLDRLEEVYAERGRREDGAIATLKDLCRLPLFQPEMPPERFFSRSWIIRLTQDLPELVRVSIVTLVTDALDRYLNSLRDSSVDENGNRALRIVCVIDEAHRVLGARLPGLSGLIRLSRSKGGAVFLISQSPDDFQGEDDDFLSEMGVVLAFATFANTRSVRRILGPEANLSLLEKGQGWIKLRGETRPRKLQVW